MESDLAETVETMKEVIGKWGKKAAEATSKAQDLAGNMWQHCIVFFLSSFFVLFCVFERLFNYLELIVV